MTPDDFITFPVPPPPDTQALASSTFRKPQLDGTLSVPELYDWHYENTPEHPIFVHSDDRGVETTIKWPEAVRAVHRAARIVQSLVQEGSAEKGQRMTFAILAAVDTITYFTVMVGIVRAGHVAFPISPRNSPAAVAHLLSKTSAEYVLVGPEGSLQNLANETMKILGNSDTVRLPSLNTIPLFPELYREDDVSNFQLLPAYKPKWDDAAIILHSSGSTAFPKPIVWTHHRYLLLSMVPFFGERDFTGYRLACHSMPMFHGMGMMQTAWTAACGLVLTAFRPQSPAVAPTPVSVLKGAVATHSDILFCVPSFVETWAKSPDDMKLLQETQGILYGGGPLSQAAGDHLIEAGVDVFILYGSTEVGIMSPIIPRTSSKDWNYFNFPSCLGTKLVPDGNGNFELLIVPTPSQVPCVLNTIVDGQPAYATSDLLAPHPTKPGYWRIFGRADDQIMHSTGEKTNPGPLENILNADSHVQAAVMFGRGQFTAGVIVDPRAEFKFDPADEKKLAQFRNAIWPTVERMNAYAPQHSRIFKEMIIVSLPSKPFTYTAKNTARRQAILQDYEVEIEAQYASVGETTQTDITAPEKWDAAHVLPFVRAVVSEVLTVQVNDTEDFILKGCDSLQATWIRNTVLGALRNVTKVDTRALPNSLVYQHPTVGSLTAFLCGDALVHQDHAGSERPEDGKVVHAMLNMVAKYGSNWPSHVPQKVDSTSRTRSILLTGTTGALGANVLAKLLVSPEIVKIYALNRKNGGTLKERQKQAFVEQGLDSALLDSSRLVLIELDSTDDRIGLDDQTYEEIRTNITNIIHLAWPVNFSLSLASFEPNVKFVRDLIDLALSSPRAEPPNFLFASTVGIIRQIPDSVPVKEEPVNPDVAVGTGYSESKWVAEKLLEVAAENTTLCPVSVRIGQLSGGKSGVWNRNEWFPSLVRSGIYLGSLPALDKDVSWVPLDSAAEVIIEMAQTNLTRYLHLSHPRPVPWVSIIEAFAKELNIPLVPYHDWLICLSASAAGLDDTAQAVDEILRKNPALKLLDLFQSAEGTMPSPAREAMGLAKLDLTETLQVAHSLKTLRQLDDGDVRRWLAYWQSAVTV